jgi:hypothetical protein
MYVTAVEEAFGADIDYSMIRCEEPDEEKRPAIHVGGY